MLELFSNCDCWFSFDAAVAAAVAVAAAAAAAVAADVYDWHLGLPSFRRSMRA
jgi:hypothetical protein